MYDWEYAAAKDTGARVDAPARHIAKPFDATSKRQAIIVQGRAQPYQLTAVRVGRHQSLTALDAEGFKHALWKLHLVQRVPSDVFLKRPPAPEHSDVSLQELR